MTIKSLLLTVSTALALAACGNVDSAHLVFGQQHTVGLTIAGSGPTQEAELTLGFKDKNIAVVPVAVKNEDGTYTKLGGGIPEGENGGSAADAYSTLGQFELKAGSDSGPNVSLGKFFATGTAAQVLSQGFADKLSGVNKAPLANGQ